MKHYLPDAVISSIQQSYLHGVSSAEKGYRYAQEDEDVVTGALGQALLSEDQSVIVDGAVYLWRTTYQKFRGRGKNAGEKLLGADGIFQIEVRNGQQEIIARKGLLFQAKNNWQEKDAKLKTQAGLLVFPSDIPIGVIVNYSPRGYYAIPTETVYDADGDWRKIKPNEIQTLAHMLSEEFVLCRLGLEDVFYDPISKILYLPKWTTAQKNVAIKHVVTTTVVQVLLG